MTVIDTAIGSFNFGDLFQAECNFAAHDITIFRNFIFPETAANLQDYLFNRAEVLRKDFLMPSSHNTPRHMSVVSGLFLNTLSDIVKTYRNPHLLSILDQIAYNGDRLQEGHVACYEDPLENMVATRLEKQGDTHGFHYDDPALALIICLEAPPTGMGGDVEYYMKGARGHRFLNQTHLNIGDAYFMRTDCTFHRVMPLKGNFPRSILNLTYDFEKRKVQKNGSAELLFQPA